MTNRVKEARQGERRGPGTPPQPRPADASAAEGVCEAWACGWRVGRQMSGGLDGDYSQREVLTGASLSLSTNTRGTPSFSSSVFRPLEGKERNLTFSGPLLAPGAVLNPFTYLIAFNPVILGGGVPVALHRESTGSEIRDLAQGHTARKCECFLSPAGPHYSTRLCTLRSAYPPDKHAGGFLIS